MSFRHTAIEPPDVGWDHYDSARTFHQRWIVGPMRLALQIAFYALLMYTPLILYTISYLRNAKAVPADFAMTLLGILFSSGNGVVGLMFYWIAEALPFRHGGKRSIGSRRRCRFGMGVRDGPEMIMFQGHLETGGGRYPGSVSRSPR